MRATLAMLEPATRATLALCEPAMRATYPPILYVYDLVSQF